MRGSEFHPSEQLVMTAEAAAKAAQEIGFPIGIKIVSPDIVHKTDVGGVALGLADEAAAIAAVEAMRQRVSQTCLAPPSMAIW